MTFAPLTSEKAYQRARRLFATEQSLLTRRRNQTFSVIMDGDSLVVTPHVRKAGKPPIRIPKAVFRAVYDHLATKPNALVRDVDDITHNGSYLFAMIDAVKAAASTKGADRP
jgi:hypothetical protein